MSSAVIDAHELTRRFGAFTAVDRATFHVARGEVFGFLGPNGAGKTTTIRMLTGLLHPTEGHATVAGFDVGGDTGALRSRIGYMSQSFSLYADLSVSENIELFGGLYGVTGARLAERTGWVLEMAGLRGREAQPAGELPLGFKQRLALGCAVLHDPPVLFLDEPTSGVDPLARRAFWDLIRELSQAGTTVLVSTHYMEEAEYCDRLLLMNRGRIIADGTPTALRRLSVDPLYEVETDAPARAVESLVAADDVIEASLFGRALHVTVRTGADPAAVAAVLRAAGHVVGTVRPVAPSLEDVFVSLVRREGGAVIG